MEPTVVHDDPVTRNGALLAPESSMGTDGNQQQALNESRKVTLLLKLVPEEVLPQEQPQKHILESYLKELLGVPSEEQPAAEPAGETEGREAAPEPGLADCGSHWPQFAVPAIKAKGAAGSSMGRGMCWPLLSTAPIGLERQTADSGSENRLNAAGKETVPARQRISLTGRMPKIADPCCI
ncbi:hypothetical protein UY3_04617 [Chelonia mydas]|uniref:Uncharacterized protein n=1 Tax=Chelonia mydas TaxID=8469 RepID=M7BR47_CHEMY|nr:hypothetical protein UY3_04617 [Chelonia mydas]